MAGKRSELLVEKAHDFFLVQSIDKAAHQRAQVGCRGGDGLAVTGYVGEKQTADAARGATGNVIDISAALGLPERLAVDPDIETTQFDAAGGKLAAAPDLHALHVPRGRLRHGSIITVGRESSRIFGYSSPVRMSTQFPEPGDVDSGIENEQRFQNPAPVPVAF